PGNGISNAMLEIDKGIRRPEFTPQLLGADELARRPQKNCQYLQRTPLDRQKHAEAAQLSSLEVQLERGEADGVAGILCLHRTHPGFAKSITNYSASLGASTALRRRLGTLPFLSQLWMDRDLTNKSNARDWSGPRNGALWIGTAGRELGIFKDG